MPQDKLILIFGLSAVTAFFLLSLVRIFRLSRANSRLRVESAKMEKQAVLQQIEVTAIHHDSMSWRAKTQRQFDALRSELSHRLLQVDQGGANALKEMDAMHQQTLAVALAKVSELEAALAAKPPAFTPPAFTPPAPVAAALPKPPPPPSSLPALPAMDTLRIQSLETELAAAKAEILNARQQNSTLQRALLIARRRLPVAAVRKSPPKSMARCA